jgi:hypothetical protein
MRCATLLWLITIAAWPQSARADMALQVTTQQVSEAVDGDVRALDAFIAANRAPLLACYAQALAQLPATTLSPLRLRVVAAANGQVVEATVLEGAPVPPMLASCLAAAARAWSLPLKKPHGFTAVHLLTPRQEDPQALPDAAPPPVAQTPRSSLALGALKVSAEVDHDALVRFVRARQGGLLQCYESALKTGEHKGAAKAKALFSISPEGRAVEVELRVSPACQYLNGCLASVFKGWRLPFHPSREVAVEQALEFTPPAR